jgi:hypothetical protein
VGGAALRRGHYLLRRVARRACGRQKLALLRHAGGR